MPYTFQVAVEQEYKSLFASAYTEPLTISAVLEKLGIDDDVLDHVRYLRNVKNDLMTGNYSTSSKL